MDILWEMLHPKMTPEHLGLIPFWLSDDDPDPAWKQIDKNYQHGGGWTVSGGGKWRMDENHVLSYPGDPPLRPLARALLRDELILFYDHAMVAIEQPDKSFEVARID